MKQTGIIGLITKAAEEIRQISESLQIEMSVPNPIDTRGYSNGTDNICHVKNYPLRRRYIKSH